MQCVQCEMYKADNQINIDLKMKKKIEMSNKMNKKSLRAQHYILCICFVLVLRFSSEKKTNDCDLTTHLNIALRIDLIA